MTNWGGLDRAARILDRELGVIGGNECPGVRNQRTKILGLRLGLHLKIIEDRKREEVEFESSKMMQSKNFIRIS